MNREVSVHLPERVWTAVVDYELYPSGLGLATAVRQRLRDAVESPPAPPLPSILRVATMTREECDMLENWLSAICARPDAPRDCRTALELVREARRLSS